MLLLQPRSIDRISHRCQKWHCSLKLKWVCADLWLDLWQYSEKTKAVQNAFEFACLVEAHIHAAAAASLCTPRCVVDAFVGSLPLVPLICLRKTNSAAYVAATAPHMKGINLESCTQQWEFECQEVFHQRNVEVYGCDFYSIKHNSDVARADMLRRSWHSAQACTPNLKNHWATEPVVVLAVGISPWVASLQRFGKVWHTPTPRPRLTAYSMCTRAYDESMLCNSDSRAPLCPMKHRPRCLLVFHAGVGVCCDFHFHPIPFLSQQQAPWKCRVNAQQVIGGSIGD